MDYNINTDAFNLQMFSDGTGGAEGASAAGKGSLATSTATEHGSVVAEQTDNSPVDLDAEFDSLTKGKYKQAYQKKFKRGLDDRFKTTDSRIKQYEKLTASLAETLGVEDSSDLDAIERAAAEQRKAGLSERAFAAGRSEEDQALFENLMRDKAKLNAIELQRQRDENARRQYDDWVRQADALQKTFPDFDIHEEVAEGGRFAQLLFNGNTVEEAYRATHAELIPNAMAYTAQQVEQGVVERIKANGLRPVENAAAQSVPISTKQDPSKMSLQDINEAIKKAQLGERVTFS